MTQSFPLRATSGLLATLLGLAACAPTTATTAVDRPSETAADANVGVNSGIDSGTKKNRTDNAQEASASISNAAKTESASVSRPISEGFYAMGGTDQGIEVQGKQYRYVDELGEQDWQPLSQLTSVGPGLIFDGQNYWCQSDQVPDGGGVCTPRGWQAYATIGQIATEELSLGGVAVGARASEVLAALGEPDQQTEVSDYSAEFIYPGMMVSFFEDAALTIRSVSPSYCAPLGACPGMAVSEVEAIYGAGIGNDGDYGKSLTYGSNEAACSLELDTVSDVVESIEIVCQP